MKKCPQCERVYDQSMSFCLDDGAELLYGPASMDEPATAILHETAEPGEAATRARIHATDQTAVYPSGVPEVRKRSFDKRILAGGALVAVAVIAGFFAYRYFSSGVASGTIDSIAVLPFANASGDKEADFLADGIAETLINNFTKIPSLKVTARSTAFRFRGREGEPVEVGRELKVGSMLTGRLMQRGDELSVQVDLISTSDGSQIWGNRYEGKTSDLVNIQQRIATDVSSQLKLKLTGAQEKQIASTYTQNAEAYKHYLRGRYHWNRRTSDAMLLAVSEFQKAVEKDPVYALGYVGLADAYVLQQEYGSGTSEETISRARAYALKALEIDPSLGEAHATLGLAAHYAYQWTEAQSHFKKAIELTPRYATAYQWYSATFRDMGRSAEAVEVVLKARELDPLSGIIGVNVGLTHAINDDFRSAEQQFKGIIELDRGWWGGYFWLGLATLTAGRKEESLPYLLKGVEMNRSSRTLGTYGFALAVTGRKAEALAIVRELEQSYNRAGNYAVNIAGIYSGLGDNNKAFEWMEKAYADRNSELARLKWHPHFDPIRDDPRFAEWVRRMKFPE